MNPASTSPEFPKSSRIALKEWAVTVRALNQGSQVLLLRKGGIREEGKDFRVVHPEFILYPTYEHQRPDLLKAPYQGDLQQVLDTGYTRRESTLNCLMPDTPFLSRQAKFLKKLKDYL